MKILSLFLVVLILFSGCTTVPRVNESKKVEEGVYLVKISSDFKPDTHKYAINNFVKSKGGETYDMELVKDYGLFHTSYDYKVTIPGSIAVEDLPEKEVTDVDATTKLIVAPVAIAGAVAVVWLILTVFTGGHADKVK